MSITLGTVITLPDVLTEGADAQYVDLDLVDAEGTPIAPIAVTSIVGTLRSLDTEALLFADADLVATGRASNPPGAPGRLRITFTAADMAATGPRQLQRRMLTVVATHSDGLLFHCGVVFSLVTLADA